MKKNRCSFSQIIDFKKEKGWYFEEFSLENDETAY